MLTLSVFTGCTYNVKYKPEILAQKISTLQAKFDGKVLVYTEEKEDLKEYSQNPSSYTGAVTTLKADVGIHVREIAKEVLSKLFTEGADHSNKLENLENYSIIIQPEVLNYDYRYNQLKNVGFAITPEAKVDLYIYFKDKEGNEVFSKKYSGDYISGGSYMISGEPHERINKAIHESIYNMLLQVASDIQSHLN